MSAKRQMLCHVAERRILARSRDTLCSAFPRDLRNVWLAVDVLTSVELLEALFELVLEVFGARLCAFVIQLASSGMLKLFRAARDLTFFN